VIDLGALGDDGVLNLDEVADVHVLGQFRAGTQAGEWADLGAPVLPFVVAQIGEFLYDRGPGHAAYPRVVNAALAALPEKVPATACVPSKGLKDKGDVLHFDAASQRELGRRYAADASLVVLTVFLR